MKMTEEYKTTWVEDEEVESAVLQQLLDLHPTRLTLEELAREFGARSNDFADHDAVERAVRDLTGAGLLHRGGEFVVPTRAALRFNELLDREGPRSEKQLGRRSRRRSGGASKQTPPKLFKRATAVPARAQLPLTKPVIGATRSCIVPICI